MKVTVTPGIDADERATRRRAIDFARGSVRLEGVVLSAEVEEINRRYVACEFDGEQHVALIKTAVLNPT